MISFATLAMIGWIPLILVSFSLLKPRQAIIAAYIVGWMYLPNLRWDLPGLPGYDKTTATNLGVLAAILLFDLGRLARFRPGAIDVPVIVFCVCPIGTSLTNGYGLYDGLAGVWGQAITWGIPWVIGRCYFGTLPALRELAVGMFVSGIVYAPLCLFEMAFGAILHLKLYGYYQHSVEQTVRAGGAIRPMVFMSNGIMLSIWMGASAVAGLAVARDAALTRLPRTVKLVLAVGLVVVTVMCHSAAAIVLTLAGVTVWYAARWMRVALPITLLVAAIPCYMVLRVSGILDVQQLMGGLSASMQTIGISPDMTAERLHSAGVRFDTEDHLFEQMWRSPVFGVGSWYFNQYVDPQTGEVDTVTIDGYWTLQLATRGLLGLCSWLALSLLPILAFLRRYPLRSWETPIVSTGGALAVVLLMHTIDCIPNPNVDPLFTLIASGLIGLPALGSQRAARGARKLRKVPAAGQPGPAPSPGPSAPA